jgi:hypothetical protein
MADHAWLTVTLHEWLENQRHEHTPHRAALSAAIDGGDTATVRRLLADAPFNPEQRRYLDDLLDRWEEALSSDE